MYCTKCGKRSEDGAKFCEHCGTPMNVEAEAGEVKKAEKPKMKKMAMALGAVAVVVVIAAVALFGGKTINLSKYVTLTVTGYEGYGKAEWDFDSEAFEEECGTKIKFTKEAEEEFGDWGIEPWETVEAAFTGSLDKEDGLSNGDKVTFSWNEVDADEIKMVFKNKFKLEDVSIKVEGLEEVESFDAFADIYIEYSGCEPTASARVINNSKDSFLQGLSYEVENASGLSNGDTITVKVSANYQDDLASYCAENIGKVPETDTKEYTVEGLNAYVTSIEQIPEDFLNKMKTEVEDHLRAETAGWMEEVSLETVTYIGAYVINKKPDVYASYGENRVYLIYNVGVHEDFSDDGVDNHINYYYYGAFSNVMMLADGTCSADLASMAECDETFRRELDVEYGRELGLAFWEPTTRLTYHGFEELDSLFNNLITAKVDNYTYTSTVEDIEVDAAETEENTEEVEEASE